MIIDDKTRSAWSDKDVINNLIKSADILLREKDYDGHGWEELQVCLDLAKERFQPLEQQFRGSITGEQMKEFFAEPAQSEEEIKSEAKILTDKLYSLYLKCEESDQSNDAIIWGAIEKEVAKHLKALSKGFSEEK